MTKEKIPTFEDFKATRDLYRRLRFKISFPEKRWLMDATGYEDYLKRMKKLAVRYRVKIGD